MSSVKKVVLAYSGGLDTSIIIPWIKENYGGAEIIGYCGDVGQGEDLEAVKGKALATGASKCIVEDLREVFVRDYCFKAMQAGAMYEGRYLLGTSLARPLLGYGQVMCALAEGADAVAHGATGKGNDQVRFEVAYATFAPHLRVIAPWKEWNIRSREDALDYAAKHNIPVEQTRKDLFSRDGNLWHLSHEGGNLEDPWSAPVPEMFRLSVEPEDAPDKAEELSVAFEQGVPVSVDGRKLGPVALVEELNRRAAAHGVGRLDIVEDRLVGMKSRGVYETPGGTVLYAAHRELESMCLDRQTIAVKNQLAIRYSELVYDGLWFSTLRNALAAFVDFTQQEVSGEVRLRLFKGSVTAVGRRSPRSLYREDLATFGEGMKYDHKDAEGFIRLFSLPERVRAITREGRGR
jgi:argininosuccinate synthase